MNDRIPLSFLLTQNRDADPPVEPIVPFPALYLEDPRICTAVLERTAVLASTTDQYERVTARHDQIYVDPSMLEWRTKTASYEGSRLNDEGRKRKGISKSPWRVGMAITYAELDGDRPEQRARSDERARKNQQEVRGTEEKELRLLRLRQPIKPAEPEEKEEVGTIVQREPFIPNTAAVPSSTITITTEKLKPCRRCGEDKPRSEFAATGIYGGYCSTCEPIEKAERAAARDHAVGIAHGGRPAKGLKPAKRKYTRSAKREATSDKATDKIGAEVTANGYEHIVKLLHRRDALKLELARVNEQLQETLA